MNYKKKKGITDLSEQLNQLSNDINDNNGLKPLFDDKKQITFQSICLNEIESGTGFNGFDDVLNFVKLFNVNFNSLVTLEINEQYPTEHWVKSLLSDINNMIKINNILDPTNKNNKYHNKQFGSFQICCDDKGNSYQLFSSNYYWDNRDTDNRVKDALELKEKSKNSKKNKKNKPIIVKSGKLEDDEEKINDFFNDFKNKLVDNKYTVYILNTIKDKNLKFISALKDYKSFDFTINGIKDLINFYISNNAKIQLKPSYRSLFGVLLNGFENKQIIDTINAEIQNFKWYVDLVIVRIDDKDSDHENLQKIQKEIENFEKNLQNFKNNDLRQLIKDFSQNMKNISGTIANNTINKEDVKTKIDDLINKISKELDSYSIIDETILDAFKPKSQVGGNIWKDIDDLKVIFDDSDLCNNPDGIGFI